MKSKRETPIKKRKRRVELSCRFSHSPANIWIVNMSEGKSEKEENKNKAEQRFVLSPCGVCMRE